MDKAALKRWGIILGCAGLLVFAACAFAAWEFKDLWLPKYVELRTATEAWLKNVSPVAFFSLMAIVPVVPVPMSFFYLSCGIFPPQIAIPGIIIALSINFTITYWLVVTLMRPLAEKLLARANLKIPTLSSRKNEILFAIFIRVCGTPFTLQNYIIPLAKINYRDYMIIGLIFQLIPAIAMMYLGNSILSGEARKGFIAVGVLVAVGIATKLIKDYLEKRRTAQTNQATQNAVDAGQ